MAKRGKSDSRNGEKWNANENVKVEDIVTAAQSMAGPRDYSQGYGKIMKHGAINKGASKAGRRGAAD